MKKGKIALLAVIGILLVGTIMLGTSYAVWNVTKSQDDTNIVRTDCFNISFNGVNDIYLNEVYPISDSEGEELSPYTFTVKNTCNRAINYNVNLEYMNSSTIDTNFVRVKLDDYAPVTYKDKEGAEPVIEGASKAASIASGILEGQETKTFNIRLWIKESATSEDVGNTTFASRVSVVATPNRSIKDVTLHLNGGSLSYTKISVTPGRAFVNLPYPTKEGYAFKGWYNNEEFETQITGETIMSEGISDLYAKWAESDHTITLHPGEGSVNPTTINVIIGEALGELPGVISNDDEFPFNGWYSDNSLTNRVTSETIVTSDLTDLYAKLGLDYAYMISGESFNTKIKQLAKPENNVSSPNFNNDNIKSIKRAEELDTEKNYIDVATSTSNNKIYVWFDNTDDKGIIYYYTDANKIKLNNNTNKMFYKLVAMQTVDLSGFDSSSVTSMNCMFSGDSSLLEIDLSPLDTSNVTDMEWMFSGCSSLTSIDFSNFDTSNVTDMGCMFSGDSSLRTLDLTSFNTSKVTTMGRMFDDCESLTDLRLNSFDTSNVTSMICMFENVNSIITLDLSSFDTSKVENMFNMFYSHTGSNLTTIYVGSKWSTASVTSGGWMFTNASHLVGGAGTHYYYVYSDVSVAHVDGGQENPGYLTLKTN